MKSRNGRIPRPLPVLAALALMVVGGCQRPAISAAPAGGGRWVGSWGTAPQLVEPANLPPEPGLAGNTLRQIVQLSLGGNRVRVHFSNAFGTAPVTINAARIAVSAGGSAIDPATDRALSFGGSAEVTLPPGEAVLSDPLALPLEPLSRVAVSIHFGSVSSDVTGHPGSRTTSYLQPGNAVTAPELPEAVTAERWYILTGIDVLAGEATAAVVVLGNSITDGRGSGTDRQNRWPDELARRLQANPGTADVAVLNMGIGGNCVLRACLGPSALSRFERDVLEQSGVRWLIVLEGVNDIGQAVGAEGAAAVARELIAAYQQMIRRAHARGVRVYGATILPFGGSFYDSPEREAARQSVNAWIRSSGELDGVIDTDAALRDPANPSRLLPLADTGDHLHPNELGHRMIAEAVDLALFGLASFPAATPPLARCPVERCNGAPAWSSSGRRPALRGETVDRPGGVRLSRSQNRRGEAGVVR